MQKINGSGGKFFPKIVEGHLKFDDDVTKQKFKTLLENNDGKHLKIVLEEPITKKMHGFYHVAVIPYCAIQMYFITDWINRLPYDVHNLVHEELKREFNGHYVNSPFTGKSEKLGGPTNEFNKSEMNAYLKRIEDYFLENGYQFPDSKLYLSWKDSAPMVNEEYPEVVKLRDQFRIKNNKVI